jgi:valyl-tRNA synthetase
MRFTLATMAAPGSDLIWTEDRIQSSRNFANKIWNASRFVLTNISKLSEMGIDTTDMLRPAWGSGFSPRTYSPSTRLPDRWVYSRLWRATKSIHQSLQGYRFHEAAQSVYHFFWDDFCDWYLEWVKPDITSANPSISQMDAYCRLIEVFSASLRLLHPFMPFITEELWFQLHESGKPRNLPYRSLAVENYEVVSSDVEDRMAEEDMSLLQEIIVSARQVRAEMKLDTKLKVVAYCVIHNPVARDVVLANLEPVLRLARLSELRFSSDNLNPNDGPMRSTALFDLQILYGQGIDKRTEISRLKKEIERLERDIIAKRERLADLDFAEKAPQHIVENLGATMVERQIEQKKLKDRLAQLEPNGSRG